MESDGIAAFGEPRAPPQHQTHWLGYDPNSGIYYYGYRFYNPTLQRWLNRDPLGETFDVNLYRFAYNSPTKYVDPNGLWGITFGNDDGSSYVNFGWGDPTFYFLPDSLNDIKQGAAATADGFIPFGDPFKKYYDPCDKTLQTSKKLGALSRDLLATAAVPNIGTWVKSPLMYEIGQKTLPAANYANFEYVGLMEMPAIHRGEVLVQELGWGRALLPQGGGSGDWELE